MCPLSGPATSKRTAPTSIDGRTRPEGRTIRGRKAGEPSAFCRSGPLHARIPGSEPDARTLGPEGRKARVRPGDRDLLEEIPISSASEPSLPEALQESLRLDDGSGASSSWVRLRPSAGEQWTTRAVSQDAVDDGSGGDQGGSHQGDGQSSAHRAPGAKGDQGPSTLKAMHELYRTAAAQVAPGGGQPTSGGAWDCRSRSVEEGGLVAGAIPRFSLCHFMIFEEHS